MTDRSLAVGTVDSYLIARLTGGRRHVTDASNASRTLLFDIAAGQWSAELCELFGVPPHALPEVTASTGEIGRSPTRSRSSGCRCRSREWRATSRRRCSARPALRQARPSARTGPGSFVLANTGLADRAVQVRAACRRSPGWTTAGPLTYALEGSVFVTGAAIQWLRDGLGLLARASDSEELARSVDDSGGVVFVPALTGLGAPDWDPDARGAIFGLTRGMTRAHLVRATLEAIAFEVRDVVDAMAADAGVADGAGVAGVAGAGPLRVDGGAAANDLLMQIQADQLQQPVERPVVAETTAIGAAFLAGLATGVWSSRDELAATWQLDRRFEPGSRDDSAHKRWREAVRRSLGWAGLHRRGRARASQDFPAVRRVRRRARQGRLIG